MLALVVVLHHSTPLRLGAWAVGLFFCLSGYWIAEMWGRKYQKLDHPYVEFLVSRWWRLAPVLFVTTALAAILMHFNLLPGDLGAMKHLRWWCSQSLIACSTGNGRLLPPTWSLDVEMQFYIVAPLLIILTLHLPKTARIAIAAIALTWCWLGNDHGVADESPRLDVWSGMFLLGILASTTHWHPNKRLAIASGVATTIVFIAAAAMPMTRSWILLRGATGHALTGPIAATLTVGTILVAIPLAIATTAVPSNRFDRFLGDLSYPLYLFHWVMRDWYYAHLTSHPGVIHALTLLFANILGALAGALVLLFAVDRPLQRLRARWIEFHGGTPVKMLESSKGTLPSPVDGIVGTVV